VALLRLGETIPLISYGTVQVISDVRSRELVEGGAVFGESAGPTGPYKIGVIALAGSPNEEWIKSVSEEIGSSSRESIYSMEFNKLSTKNNPVISIRSTTLLSRVLSDVVRREKSLVNQLVFSLGGIIFLLALFLLLKTEKVIEDA
jgi:hypothetical protein